MTDVENFSIYQALTLLDEQESGDDPIFYDDVATTPRKLVADLGRKLPLNATDVKISYYVGSKRVNGSLQGMAHDRKANYSPAEGVYEVVTLRIHRDVVADLRQRLQLRLIAGAVTSSHDRLVYEVVTAVHDKNHEVRLDPVRREPLSHAE